MACVCASHVYGYGGGTTTMSPVEQSVVSILEAIACEHPSYASLQEDRRFQVWMKHATHKRQRLLFFKTYFEEKKEQIAQARYF